MSFFGAVMAVLLKDLKIELRSREIVLATALFALLVVLLSAFAFGLNVLPGGDASAGVLWIAVSFSGILTLERTYAREREMSVWNAMLMAPAPRGALYLGKLLGVLIFLLVVELVLVPVIELFFHAPLLAHLGPLSVVLVLATLGYAAAGTLFAAMSVRTRLKDLLLGVILYPLVAPLLIGAVKATTLILAGEGLDGAGFYLKLIFFFDMIFVVGGLWLFGPLMEE